MHILVSPDTGSLKKMHGKSGGSRNTYCHENTVTQGADSDVDGQNSASGLNSQSGEQD